MGDYDIDFTDTPNEYLGILFQKNLRMVRHFEVRKTKGLKAIGWINTRCARFKCMPWRNERILWNAKGWSTLTYACEMDPWQTTHPLETIEIQWLRSAFCVGPTASGWALYWLSGILPATFRIWTRGLLFYDSIWKKASSNWEKTQMANHWVMF